MAQSLPPSPSDPSAQPVPEERPIRASRGAHLHRLPYPPPAAFAGRAAEMHRLVEFLEPHLAKNPGAEEGDRTRPRSAVIIGWDGLGKTSLALKFCTAYGSSFKNLHWIRASHDPGLESSLPLAQASLRAQIAACGASLGLPHSNLEKLFAATCKAWREEATPLIVFDDLDQPGQLEPILPELPVGARILITTRWQAWPPDQRVRAILLDSLPRRDSLATLRKHAEHLAPAENDHDLDHLAHQLCDLPLALELAGRLLSLDPKLTPFRLSAALDHPHGEQPESLADHSHILEPLARLSWRGLRLLDHRDGVARAVISLAAYCAPGAPIPKEILTNALLQARRAVRPTLALAWVWEWATKSHHEEGIADILARLESLGLLHQTRGGGAILHPLLARLIQRYNAEAPGPLAARPRHALARTTAETTQSLEVGSPANRAITLAFRPHLAAACALAEKENLEQTAELWLNLGTHYHAFGEYEPARICLLRAIRSAQKRLGDMPVELVKYYTRMAEILQAANDLTGERQAYQRALAIVEKARGFYHPDTAGQAAQLGRALLEASEAQYQRVNCLESALLACSPDGENQPVARLARDLLEGGEPDAKRNAARLSEALAAGASPRQPAARLICALIEASDLPARRETARLLLALYQASLANQEETALLSALLRPSEQGIFEGLVRSLLPETDLTGAQAGRVLGELIESSEPGLRRATGLLEELMKASSAPDQPDGLERAVLERVLLEVRETAAARRTARLGLALEARPHLERALRIYERQLVPDLEACSVVTYNLGLVLHCTRELVAAREILEHSLRLAEEKFGPADEKTALRQIGLGAVLWSLGDLARARQSSRQGLKTLQEKRPPGDPLVASVQQQLEQINESLNA